MNQREVSALRTRLNKRLGDHGHPVTWRKDGGVHRGLCRACGAQVDCDEYGTHYRGGLLTASFLKFPGVNIIRRCPGGG